MSGDRRRAYAGEHPPLSVVIPTHKGGASWLRPCLEALVEQEGPVPEVLVVLDGPASQEDEVTSEVLPAAGRLRLPKAHGFAHAANLGLRSAKGELVVLLNDDTVIQPGFLAAITDGADRHPEAGSFACRVLSFDAPSLIDSAGHGLTRWGEAFAIGQGDRDSQRYDEEGPVFGAPGCAAVYRQQLLLDCGGFDPTMEAYLEDIELSLRAQGQGFPCVYLPQARVFHRGSASYDWGGSSGRAERLAARNRIRLMLRGMPRSTLRAASPAAAVSILADLAARTVRGKQAGTTLQGLFEGLQGAVDAAKERPQARGQQLLRDTEIQALLKASEQELLAVTEQEYASLWRRQRGRVVRGLAAWTDRRELCMERQFRWSH